MDMRAGGRVTAKERKCCRSAQVQRKCSARLKLARQAPLPIPYHNARCALPRTRAHAPVQSAVSRSFRVLTTFTEPPVLATAR